jgi:hypothetical protein
MNSEIIPDLAHLVPVCEIFGHKVILNSNLLMNGDPVTVRRGWKERLLSRPWRPFHATSTYIPRVPDTAVYQLGGGYIVAHPNTIAKLRMTALLTKKGNQL